MIDKSTTIEQIGAIVCQALMDAGIDCFLSGGAVVSIYTHNKYESYDLDFVSFGDRKTINQVMERLGFLQDRSRLFRHPESIYMVEFPGTAVQIGEEPIKEFAERIVKGKTLKLLTPTDCVKDRLAAYIHWKDKQGLDQAAMVAAEHPCKMHAIEAFCKSEGRANAYQDFLSRLRDLDTSELEVRPDDRSKSPITKVHPWRLCPSGQHWVRNHDRPNTRHGVHGYCRHNPSGKDQIGELEMDEIAERYFGRLKSSAPCSRTLGFPQGNKFDSLIQGWTQYWNEVFAPSEPLSPNLVKAIVATESGFRTRAENPGNKRIGKARGLMQITEETWRILRDEHGELGNHFVVLDQNDLLNANQNICAGIRWLFRKRETAAVRLKHSASWIETVAEFKAYLKDFVKNPNHKKMKEFIAKYETLKNC